MRAATQAQEEKRRKELEELKGANTPSAEETAAAQAKEKADADAKAREELNQKLSSLKSK